eukprot:m.200579 g.200579  ORF g.200579 m.200579 type:complete len:312 (+) comp14962_c0_seq1:169-1104(+)
MSSNHPTERAFMFGVVNIIGMTFVVGRWPEHYWIYHSIMCVSLLVYRWTQFRRKRMHYFLYDFCYLVNYMSVILCLLAYVRVRFNISTVFAHFTPKLVKVGYGFSSGPLLLAIYALRNSLVFHSADRLTTVFIHASPAILMWVLRWETNVDRHMFPLDGASMDHHFQPPEAARAASAYVELVLAPFALYLVCWTVPYYFWLFVIKANRIKEQDYDTLYTYTMKAKTLQKLSKKVPEPLQPVLYLGAHALLIFLSLQLPFLLWHSFTLHTIVLILMLASSVRNGASWYFKVFPRQLESIHEREQQGVEVSSK